MSECIKTSRQGSGRIWLFLLLLHHMWLASHQYFSLRAGDYQPYRVNDGLRSRYLRCHKPALYRLSYNHHFVLFTRLTDWLPFRKWGHPVISGLRGVSRLRSGSSGFSDQCFYQVSLGSNFGYQTGLEPAKDFFEVVPEPQSGRLPITGYWYHIKTKNPNWFLGSDFMYWLWF